MAKREPGDPRCKDCPQPHAPGKARCDVCARKHREASAARAKERAELGVCLVCGRKAAKGRGQLGRARSRYCKDHLAYYGARR